MHLTEREGIATATKRNLENQRQPDQQIANRTKSKQQAITNLGARNKQGAKRVVTRHTPP